MMKDLPNMLGTWIIILLGAYVIFRNLSGDATIMLQGTMRNVLLWGIFLMLWSIELIDLPIKFLPHKYTILVLG